MQTVQILKEVTFTDYVYFCLAAAAEEVEQINLIVVQAKRSEVVIIKQATLWVKVRSLNVALNFQIVFSCHTVLLTFFFLPLFDW